jgi:large subunit ribosomal protein L7/L12
MSARHYKRVIKIIGDWAGLSAIELEVARNNPAIFIRANDKQVIKYRVVLEDCGEKKIACIKEIRFITGLGLKEAKELSDQRNVTIKGEIESVREAEQIAESLRAIGARSTVQSYV